MISSLHRADYALALVRHPETPALTVRAIEVNVTRGADGHLALAYRLGGDISRLRIPASQPPGPADGLWRHTCFEAFVAVAGEPAYREFNFSSSGQWAAYAFSDYRQRDENICRELAAAFSTQIVARSSADWIELDVVIAPGALPAHAPGATLQLGLSAVVESVDGEIAYWALRHPGVRPDFHHRDAFLLELTDSRVAL